MAPLASLSEKACTSQESRFSVQCNTEQTSAIQWNAAMQWNVSEQCNAITISVVQSSCAVYLVANTLYCPVSEL